MEQNHPAESSQPTEQLISIKPALIMHHDLIITTVSPPPLPQLSGLKQQACILSHYLGNIVHNEN